MTLIERNGAANPFDQIDVGDVSRPTFADIDGDGDKDLIVGAAQGGFSYYRNDGNGQYTQLTGMNSPVNMIYSDAFSNISFADLDQDGDVDAIVGSEDGQLDYFRNNGISNGVMQWQRTETNSPFRQYNLTKPAEINYSSTAFVDWDGDGDLDAFVGSGFNGVLFLRNDGGQFNRADAANPFAQWNQTYDDLVFTTPTFGDFDGDGDLDAAVGSALGRIAYLQNNGGVLTAPTTTANPFLVWNDRANSVADTDQSAPTFTDVDNDGDLDVVVGIFDGRLRYLENTAGNTPTNPTVIEAAGNADLLNTNAGYQIRPDGGTAVALRYQGALVGSNFAPGWQAVGAEAVAGGYEVMWRNATGEHGVWTVNNQGEFVGVQTLSAAELVLKEAQFQQDFNGDGRLGVVVAATIEAAGNADLLNTNAGYQLRPDNGTAVSLRYQGTLVDSNFAPGWQAIGAEAVAGGYEVMWRNATGEHGLWTVNNQGEFLAAKSLSAAEVIVKEAQFQQDFNGDRTTGPVVTATIEAAGNADLINTNIGYQVRPDGGTAFSLSMQGNLVDTNFAPGWQAIGVEGIAGNAYEVMWRNVNGGYSIWKVSDRGEFLGGNAISGMEAILKEAQFQQDFNSDGRIGTVVTATIEAAGNVDLLNTNAGYQLRPDNGTAFSLRYQGAVVDSNFAPGWQAVGAEAVAGAYEVMWRNVNGEFGTWTVNNQGEFVAARSLSGTDLILKESVFQQDFNGDNTIGPVVTATIEAAGNTDLLNTNAGYQVRPDGGTAISMRFMGSLVDSNFAPGWQAVGAETKAGGGYEVMWRNTNGEFGTWTLDSQGEFTGVRTLNAAEVIQKEATFQQDFNGDRLIGATAMPSAIMAAHDWSEFAIAADRLVAHDAGVIPAVELGAITAPIQGAGGSFAQSILQPLDPLQPQAPGLGGSEFVVAIGAPLSSPSLF